MVGGAVRNALLELPVAEIDVATTAVPDEVMRRVEAAGFKAVPTGIEHGTVTVVVDSQPFEVTTLRQDVETFGRKAKVAFGRDWASRRRAARLHHQCAFGFARRQGLRLCRRPRRHRGAPRALHRRAASSGSPRTICASCASSASTRISAKALPDAAGLLACIRGRAGLETLSRERVRMELLKLLLAPRAAPTLAVMAESGHPRHGARRRAAISRASRTWPKIEAALGMPRRCGAAARRARRVGQGGCRAAGAAAAPLQRRSRAADGTRIAGGALRRSPASRPRARCSIVSGRNHLPIACWSPGRARRRVRRIALGAILRPCRSAGPRRRFRSSLPISSAAACRRARRWAPRMRAAKEAWIAADFPAERAPRSRRLPSARRATVAICR